MFLRLHLVGQKGRRARKGGQQNRKQEEIGFPSCVWYQGWKSGREKNRSCFSLIRKVEVSQSGKDNNLKN